MTAPIVTDETTRSEIEEALGWANQSAKRIPSHWLEHRRRAHEKINSLLDALDALAMREQNEVDPALRKQPGSWTNC